MADLLTNLNVPPFYDDYNEDKQYYRILFRPGTAVQARELTQLQTILQRQISRFGNSVYKDGTIIEGCTFSQYPGIEQVKFKDSNSSTFDFGLLTLNYTDIANGHILVSNTTGLRAVVFRAFAGAESAVNFGSYETNRAYVMYLNSGNNAGTQVTRFNTTSEQIDVYSPLQSQNGPLTSSNRLGSIYTLTSNSTVNALGVGYGIHVGPGIIYQKGYFLKSLPVNFVIKENSSNAAGMRVGFDTRESIIKPAADDSLYDNSTGSSNYSAPGAYRLKLTPEPVYYDSANTEVTIPDSFLPILDFDGGNGRPVISKEYEPILSTVGKIINQRTFEESGNYSVRPFQIDVSAHESNTQSFYYNVSPGIAYVDGQRVEFQSPKKIEVPRAIDTASLTNGVITFNMGNYVKIKDVAGTFDIDGLQEIQFYSANQQALSLNQSMSSPLGVPVGNANVRGVMYYEGTRGTANSTFLLYVYNIRMRAGATFAANAKSVYVASGTYGQVFADVVANTVDGKIELFEQDNRLLVYPLGVPGVKRLTSNTGVNNTTLVYRKTIQGSLSSSGSYTSTASFTIPTPDLSYYGGTSSLSELNEQYVNITFAQDTYSANVITNGTFNSVNSTAIVISSASAFVPELMGSSLTNEVGVAISNTTGGASIHTAKFVSGTTSTSTIVLVPNSNIAQAGTTNIRLRKFYKRGTHVNLSGGGNTVAISSDRKTVTLTLTSNVDTSSYSMNLQMPISRSTALPIPKVSRENTIIRIDCSTAGTTGPWSLGWPDVYQVSNVLVGSAYSLTNPDRVDWFELDNGQQDNMYNIAKLRLKPQYNGVLTAASRLVVRMNHFTPNASSSASLFFSEDSYPIDDANTANTNAIATAQVPLYKNDKGIIYDLRNCIDIRPVVANTASLVTGVITNSTINPAANSSTFLVTAGAPVAVEPDSNMTYNVEYYPPRRDIVFVNGDGSLSVKRGEPSLDPKLPAINKTGLKIAEIYVPPYPSLTFKEAE